MLGCLPDEAMERIERIERERNPDCMREIEAYYELVRKERGTPEATK